MSSTSVRLKVKYGLRADPSEQRIDAWRAEVERLVAAGEDVEVAGRLAAFERFEGVDECVYGSEADNIEALLKALAAKG